MATYYWTGDQSPNIGVAANYSSTQDGSSPLSSLPTSADIIEEATYMSEDPATGTSNAGYWNIPNTSIYGGAYNGVIISCYAIYDGTFNDDVVSVTTDVNGGTFNGHVAGASSTGGTFNSTFSFSTQMTGGTVGLMGVGSTAGDVGSGVTVNGTLTCNGFSGYCTSTGNVTFTPFGSIGTVEGQITIYGVTLYAPTAVGLAPVNKVLAGTAQAGSYGTLTLPAAGKVLASTSYGVGGNGSTGTLELPGESDVRAGVEYGEGGDGSTGSLSTIKQYTTGPALALGI